MIRSSFGPVNLGVHQTIIIAVVSLHWVVGHNVEAMNMWFAGGGVKRGTVVGATDEIASEAVEVVHPIRDVHVTMMNLLGLDDNKLTYFHAGRFKQLSQFGGEVIDELIA